MNNASNPTTRAADGRAVTHIVIACDESGAKGYAGGGEKFDGEVGIFAGLMVPDEILANAQRV
jgi:hypothetical protein